ncbi:MAG: DUF3500 domain-containing protein [Vicinamibacteria bacterium]
MTLRLVVAVGVVVAFLGVALAAERRSAAEMAAAASRFLNALSKEQRAQASFPFGSEERFRWHFIPTGQSPASWPRLGVPLKAMTDEQKQRARDLLKAGLSRRGYLTATAIMDLETVLGAIESAARIKTPDGRLGRDPELYFFSVFGEPSTSQSWAWRVEGHHVSLHFTVVNGSLLASSPSFFGTNPAEVREGPNAGLRILGSQEDAARALLASLDDSQRHKALIENVAPNEIVTSNEVAVSPLSPVGVMASDLTSTQRDLLMKVVNVYTGAMADDMAAERFSKLKHAGIEKIAFAWAGQTERGKKHYYRVQGPTFLIEYDNTQNDGNHVHSVWRDFDGDFGMDLLREHVKNQPH